MNVGIYFDLRNPAVWRQDQSRLYGFALEMCEEAEQLGCHSVWLSEHHGFDDGYLPQPLTFAAAGAARTKCIRIGTAVLIAPLHHPVHLAEQAAIVDILSNGRLELGLGAGLPSSHGSEPTYPPATRRTTIAPVPSDACGRTALSRRAPCRSGSRSGWVTKARRAHVAPASSAKGC